MKSAILLNSFGSSQETAALLDQLSGKLQTLFPGHRIITTFSSRQIERILRQRGETPASLEDSLSFLHRQGIDDIVVQSLHLFPGREFHNLVQRLKSHTTRSRLGLPLLTSPADYQHMSDLLEPIIATSPSQHWLVLGHGTDHPSWTAYPALEQVLRKRFGSRISVGVVEKFPDCSTLIEDLVNLGCTQLNIIPLFMVTGLHFRRDIAGPDENSWKTKLERAGITPNIVARGIAELEGLEHLVAHHIRDATPAT